MIPALLITIREAIEASLIVATVLGILIKLNQKSSIRTVWIATASATIVSVLLLGIGSLFGIKMQELYTGEVEEIIEGILMITSAIFITWAVFILHTYFAQYKVRLLTKVKDTIFNHSQKGLFFLVFTAVFREGFEIVLFLSTMYFSSDPQNIFIGFILGAGIGLAISYSLFSATIRLPVYQAFRATSILLILFAGGLLARGIHEFAEVGWLPEIGSVKLSFLPETTSFAGEMVKALFGLRVNMDYTQIIMYGLYVGIMFWFVFFRKTSKTSAE